MSLWLPLAEPEAMTSVRGHPSPRPPQARRVPCRNSMGVYSRLDLIRNAAAFLRSLYRRHFKGYSQGSTFFNASETSACPDTSRTHADRPLWASARRASAIVMLDLALNLQCMAAGLPVLPFRLAAWIAVFTVQISSGESNRIACRSICANEFVSPRLPFARIPSSGKAL